MKRRIKKLFSVVLVVALMLVQFGTVAFANDEVYTNLALNKPVTASSSYPNRDWTPDKVVDGIDSNADSRWSSKRATGNGTNESSGEHGTVEQWITIDLEDVYTIDEVYISWQTAYATEYKVQGSLDGDDYFDLKEVLNGTGGKITHKDLGQQAAQYIRILCMEATVRSYGYSIFEIEVHDYSVSETRVYNNAQEVLDRVGDTLPTIAPDGNSIILPELPSDDYEISLYGCDNQQVITMDEEIIKPLESMKVNLLYQVVNKEDENDVAYSDTDIPIVIPGKYTIAAEDNSKPSVVPGLREWKGSSGDYQFTSDSKIVIANNSHSSIATMIQSFFVDMLGVNIEIMIGNNPTSGDIFLINASSENELGSEGYYMEISDYITITSPTTKGLLYGGISITQILYQSSALTIPKGIARDYPKYEVRSGMYDVGREFIDMEYLTEMTKYMAWFKMSEIHIHINDVMDNGDSAFRLESNIPGLNDGHDYYTKDEYRDYQEVARQYGVTVVTEFDTPAHSGVFTKVNPDLMGYDWKHLDITKPEVYTFVENLIDEYLDGPNPVITNDVFHIGTDEYSKSYSEEMRKYTDHFIKYVNNKGFETRIWGSLGKNGFNGTTPVTNEATVNLWAPYWADVKETYNDGYDVINTIGGHLYIVPGETISASRYSDYLDIEDLYEIWDVNNFVHSRSNYSGTAMMPMAHPQTRGAQFALWNDYGGYNSGITKYDMMIRAKDAIAIISEKTWYGEKTSGQTVDDFMQRVAGVESRAPDANPRRFVESDSDIVVAYDFNEIKDNTISDQSGNGYHATSVNAKIVADGSEKVIAFDGNSYITTPIRSAGFPYTISFDIKPDSAIEPGTILFSGQDGILYISLDDNETIGYYREGETYHYKTSLAVDEWSNITIACNKKDTHLYINGARISTASNINTIARNSSTTFVFPLEKIGEGFVGYMNNLVVYNRTLSDSEIAENNKFDFSLIRENVALRKDATASSVYQAGQEASKAVDGIIDPESATADQSRWASARTNNEWIEIDLKDTYFVDQVVITWEDAYGVDYQILGSLDGDAWFVIKDIVGASSKGTVDFDNLGEVETRYIKIKGTLAANNAKYGYSIYEIEVYESTNKELERYTKMALAKFEPYVGGSKNGEVHEEFYNESTTLLNSYLTIAAGNRISVDELLEFKALIKEKISSLEENIIFDPSEIENLYAQASNFKERDFTKDSWVGFLDTLAVLKGELDALNSYVNVDALKAKFEELIDSLDTLDRTVLEEKLKELEALDENTYTHDSWTAMLSLREAAVSINNNDSLNQIDISNAIDSLNAIALIKRGDITELKEFFDSIEKNMLTAESWNTIKDIYEQAQAVIRDNSNVSQEDVDAILDILRNLSLNLEERDNFKELIELIELFLTYDKNIYTTDSWEQFETAIKDVQNKIFSAPALSRFIPISFDTQYITDAEVESMKNHILESEKLLVARGVTSELSELIKSYSGLNGALYTADSWKNFNDIYTAAKNIVADNSNASQSDIDAYIQKLKEAKEKLILLDNAKIDNAQNINPSNNNVMTGDYTTLPTWSIVSIASLLIILNRKKIINK